MTHIHPSWISGLVKDVRSAPDNKNFIVDVETNEGKMEQVLMTAEQLIEFLESSGAEVPQEIKDGLARGAN